jgi:hypothetical protein
MLSKFRGFCSPETFSALLVIYDSAWAEISASTAPRPEDVEAQRTRLAELVMAQMDRDDLAQTAKVRGEVIQAFQAKTV